MTTKTQSPISRFDVKGKVIIITGGLGSLGMQYAKALGSAGAQVVLWDNRDDGAFKNAAEVLSQSGVKITTGKVDITKEAEVKKSVAILVKKFGRIDVLVNNAAMNPAVGSEESKKQFVPFEEYPVELWRKEIDTNLTGMFICIKAVVPAMKKRGGGVIVNVASEVSNIAHDHRVYNQPGKYKSPAYVTSKTGVVGLTRACAAQFGEHNIRVNAFSLGGMQNGNLPPEFVKRFGGANMLGRMAQPDEYNAVMLFLCSDASSFMTGANLTVDGGKSAW